MNIIMAYNKIKEAEGEFKKNGLHVPYADHLGFVTIGYGTLIDDRKRGGLTDEEAEWLLMNRIQSCLRELQDALPFWDDLNEGRQEALLEMAYWLGMGGLRGFKRMIAALAIGHYERAALEAVDSKVGRDPQTYRRIKRIAQAIKSG